MAMTAGQFFLYLLIIIILRESLASAAPPSLEETPTSTRISTIPAVNIGYPYGFYQLHDFQSMEELPKGEVYIEGAEDCEPDSHSQRLVNQLKGTSSSLQIDLRSYHSRHQNSCSGHSDVWMDSKDLVR